MQKNTVSLAAVNAFRISHDLEPFVAKNPKKKSNSAANRIARANECRELKARRNSGKSK